MKQVENTNKINEFIYNKFVSNELNNDSIEQIIEHSRYIDKYKKKIKV